MTTNLILTAASIIDPIGENTFDGTLDEALTAMIAYAAEWRIKDFGTDQVDLTRVLRNSDPDRVAEVAASALLRLADMDPQPTLTRADKERAVAEMAKRLSAISENAAYADAYPDNFKPDGAKWFQRRERLLQAALVRLAMARTAD